MRNVRSFRKRWYRAGRDGGWTAVYIALPLRYFSEQYAGSGGRGEDGGCAEIASVYDRIEDSDGRGARNEGVDDLDE